MKPSGRRSVTASPRPIRVAFIVNPATTSNEELDEIIVYCCGRWGGRYFPIIPSDGNDIADDWWKLLVLSDPDIVHAGFQLSDALVEKINRTILPFKITELSPKDRETKRFLDFSSLQDLHIENIPTALSQRKDPFRRDVFHYIKDRTGPLTSTISFITRNFGCLGKTLATQRAFAGLDCQEHEIDKLDPKQFLLDLVAAPFRHIFPATLSLYDCTLPFQLGFDRNLKGHHIVVGDSVWDILYAWNRAQVAPSWGPNIHTVWLPKTFSDDKEQVLAIVNYLAKRSWTNQEGSHKVVSYSLPEDKLKELAELCSNTYHSHFVGKALSAPLFTLPEAESIRSTRPASTLQLADASDFSLLEIPRPSFVDNRSEKGSWAVDLDLEMTSDPAVHYSSPPTWKLPKRLGVTLPFLRDSPESRVNARGGISIFPNGARKNFLFREPPIREVIWTFLNQAPLVNLRRHEDAWKKGRFQAFETSDKGVYLRGVIGLFGGLWWAAKAFEDKYWRSLFQTLAAKPTETFEDIHSAVTRVLSPIVQADGESIKAERNRFDEGIAQVSELLFKRRQAQGFNPIPHRELERRFKEMREEANRKKDDSDFRDGERFEDWRLLDLANHLENKILLQGSAQQCPACLTKDWHHVDQLRADIRCAHCFHTFPLGPNPEWSYKLNGLLENAVSRHGTMPVIQALYILQSSSQGSFAYSPSQDLFEKYEYDRPQSFTDLDVVALVEGKLVLGEVKSNPKMVTEKDFDKMRAIADELLPDYLVFFAAENDTRDRWPDWLDGRIKAANVELNPKGVRVLKHLMNWKPQRISLK